LRGGELTCIDLGLVEYSRVWRLQLRLVEKRISGEVGDVLILVEHPHVFTLGRRGDENNILDKSIPVYRVERGGDATYHGPGQLVAYPIVNLNELGLGVREFVNLLEEVCISVLGKLGVGAGRVEGKPGVWVKGRKIVSIGLAIRHWVTYHGLAFNVNTDLSYFFKIRPCGMDSDVMTSLQQVTGQTHDLSHVKQLLAVEMAERLGLKLRNSGVGGVLEEQVL